MSNTENNNTDESHTDADGASLLPDGRTRADIARAAFDSGDLELSALAHQLPPQEMHQK